MTDDRGARRAKRPVVPAILATLGLLVALLVATPGAASGAVSGTTIMEIQGAGHLSPFDGETVTTQGIVTAVAFNGFYAQDPTGDGDDNTSDGIFVSSDSEVEVGDLVEITGEVSESIPGGAGSGNLSSTTLTGDAVVLSSGNPLPGAVEIGKDGRRASGTTVISDDELPVNLQNELGNYDPDEDAIDFWESLEGMYVEVDRPIAVSAIRQFNAFSSEVFVLPSRGANADPSNALTSRGGILLQPDADNTGDQNPERVQIQFDGTIYPSSVPDIDVRDRIGDVRGVVGYSFGNFEVNATETVRVLKAGPRVESSWIRPQETKVSVATYNVLNLSPDASDDAQRAKVADHIANNLHSPDVVALQEIQDNSGQTDDGTTAADQTLQALVDAIAAAGGPTYEFFDVEPADGVSSGVPGGNIRNAFLYNPDRVELVEGYSLTGGPWVGTRDPLVGVFTFNRSPFTVVNNHFTSRFGSSPIYGGPQPFLQAGEAEREAQAAALNEFVDSLLADDPNAAVMVVGDLNTFEWTNDLAEILPGDDEVLTNLLTSRIVGSDSRNLYTFIFDGNSQALDHFFVTDSLLDRRPNIDLVHVNIEYSRLTSDVVASDHEPLLARFKLPDPPPPSADTFKLQVLHASDLEGGVEALDRAANFAAIVDSVEDDDEVDGSLTLSAGDNYIPGPFFNASADRATFRDSGLFNEVYNELFGVTEYAGLREEGGRVDISIMNIIEFDASALGNHEFDAGTDAVEQIIEEDFRDPGLGDDRWVGAQFPYLSANLDFSADGDLADLFTSSILENTAFVTGPTQSAAGAADTPKIAPATFITVGGERVGVVGATTQLLEIISSPGATDVIGPNANDMAQLATLIQPQVDALEALGINKIVVVSHLQQLALERELSGLLDGVDIIIAGGSDSLLANPDDALRAGDTADEAYPVLETDAAGDPVAIVSTDGQYSYVGRLVVDFNSSGQLVDADGALLVDLDGLDLAKNGPIKTEDDDVAALWGSTAAALAPGTKANLVDRLVSAVEGVVTAKDSNVVGESTVYLDGRRESVRTEETNFGNLTADANLAVAQSFDATAVLSIKNGGGIRAPIGEIDTAGNLLPPQANPLSGKLEGQVSQLDIENSLRFNNGLTLLTLTATELQAVVEHAVAATGPGATPGQFAQIGGARFVYDPTLAVGARVQQLALLNADGSDGELIIDGGALQVDPAATYRIVTLGFLAGGGDGYPFPDNALPSTAAVTLGDVLTDAGAFTFADPGSEQDALAEFMADAHGIGAGTPFSQVETDPGADSRIVDASLIS